MKDYDISVEVHHPTLLICNVTGNPPGTTITYQWMRADMSPIPTPYSAAKSLYLPYLNVSDAGVYICEVAVSDSTDNPYVIAQSGSLSVTLTVISK